MRHVTLGFALLCVLLLPWAPGIEQRLEVAARVEGSESAAVESLLRTRFDSPLARPVVLVASGIPRPTEPAGARVVADIVQRLRHDAGVAGTLSFTDRADSAFVASSGGGTYIVVGLRLSARPDSILAALRQRTAQLADEWRTEFPEIALRWTGELALNADLRRASASDVARAELRAVPLTLILLVVAFGSLAAAVLPIAAAALAIGLALGASALIAQLWPLSILLQNTVTMLGLGLGIDYSLLTISRFREERPRARSNAEAASRTVAAAAPTILLSGLAVVVGFAALAIVPVSEHRALAVGGVLIVASSVAVATLVLPALLAVAGDIVDRGRIPLRLPDTEQRWRRWGRFVVRHPVGILVIGGLPVLALALNAVRLNVALPRGEWLPKHMESAVALRELKAMGHGAAVQTLRVVVTLPDSVPVFSARGWATVLRTTERIAADSAVRRVHAIPTVLGPLAQLLSPAAVHALLPARVRDALVSRDRGAALIEVVPRETVDQLGLEALSRRLRALTDVEAAALNGATVTVGGIPAFTLDYRAAVAGRFGQVVLLIVAITFVMLALGTRSVLIPLKAIALNLLAVGGAFGAMTLVFQDGIGTGVIGLAEPLDGVFAAIPTLVFCTVFGLSMDYEVFLIARVREARAAGRTESDAIVDGLARSAGVITSAAAIMVVVFGAFTLGDFLPVKMLGFGLATAVFLDATVMRLAVSPALLALAGRWNWWPGDRVRGVRGGPPPSPAYSPEIL